MDWQSVITEHGTLVWTTAYRLLNNEADTSDCFQDVFLAAVEVSRRERIRNLPALLNRLATHRAITMLRYRMRNAAAMNRLERDADCTPASNPGHPSENGELAEHVRRAIAALPELEAQAFCLRVLNDLSYRQIALQLNIKTGHVGVLISRAKDKLQRRFPVAVDEEIEICTNE